ncbi:hypothetical protein JTE90_002173 [Oedothorax gibbosus]|uniref:Uncharacterized protein n=1 Tax=Oedothorax gibbosus TaxID=931172 RepID=A0AAV6VGC4_9ARAC|nr:hypothetical protein JTE90_002173 [Oedothorax gibbosus]
MISVLLAAVPPTGVAHRYQEIPRGGGTLGISQTSYYLTPLYSMSSLTFPTSQSRLASGPSFALFLLLLVVAREPEAVALKTLIYQRIQLIKVMLF